MAPLSEPQFVGDPADQGMVALVTPLAKGATTLLAGIAGRIEGASHAASQASPEHRCGDRLQLANVRFVVNHGRSSGVLPPTSS